MVKALSQAGVEALLATTDADGHGDLQVERGVPVVYEGARTIFFSRIPGESMKLSPALSSWLRRNVAAWDLVHVHSVFSHPSVAAGVAARKNGIPYIIRPLGQLDQWSLSQHAVRKRAFLAMWGKKLIWGAAAMHWTDSSERTRSPAFASSRPGFVVPLGVDEALFCAEPKSGRRQIVLFLSRLHPKKNLESLIESFLGVGEAFDAWRLVVVGKGEDEYVNELKALVARAGGEARVCFEGWLTGEEKYRTLREAALLALPSRQENFGIAVAEAMAAGTPVLVSEAVALAGEVDRSGAGWVAPEDVEGLRMVLSRAMSSEEELRRRGAAARRVAEKSFRWQSVAETLLREYESLLTAPSRRR